MTFVGAAASPPPQQTSYFALLACEAGRCFPGLDAKPAGAIRAFVVFEIAIG